MKPRKEWFDAPVVEETARQIVRHPSAPQWEKSDVRGQCMAEFATSDNQGERCSRTAEISDPVERTSFCLFCFLWNVDSD